MNLFPLARPFLGLLNPETAHHCTLTALKLGLAPAGDPDPAELGIDLFGLRFPNPVGIAAGFDKNAEVPDAMLRLGMGFAEIGTVTPRPQPGNPKPRIFRLSHERAVINRLGFNNEGHEAAKRRLEARRGTERRRLDFACQPSDGFPVCHEQYISYRIFPVNRPFSF